MKTYSVSFKVVIHDKATSYPEVRPIDLDVKETLPANVDPQKYLRARVTEEIKRAFDQLSEKIDNRSEDSPEDDPLA